MAIVHNGANIKHINKGSTKIAIVKKADGTVIWYNHAAITAANLVDGWKGSATDKNYVWTHKRGILTIVYNGVTITHNEHVSHTETTYAKSGKTYLKGTVYGDGEYHIGLLK